MKKNYACLKILFESGFIEENYKNFVRDFKCSDDSDFSFLSEPKGVESYYKYLALFNEDKNDDVLIEYDFNDSYNTFLLLSQNGFCDDDIKEILNHNDNFVYCYKKNGC